VEQAPGLVDAQRLEVGLWDARRLDEGGDVTADEAPAQRVVERGTQDGAQVVRRARGEAGGDALGERRFDGLRREPGERDAAERRDELDADFRLVAAIGALAHARADRLKPVVEEGARGLPLAGER